MADEAPAEGQSGAQNIARTVGVTIRLVNQTRKEVEGIVGVMERVKKLFTSTEKVAETSGARTSAAATTLTERISTLGQVAAGGGGGSAIAAMMGGVGGAVMGAVGAVQNFGSSIAQIHQSSEDMTNTMAGTFAALGLATDIDDGSARAVQALTSIRTAAAALPGEASEYITVFQSGISSLASGFNNNLDDMLSFSNQFAAIGRSLGIDAEQIGRDMNLMLRSGQAGAGADVATFQRMLPFINSYREGMHQAAVTAQTFNTMTQQQRLELVKNTIAGRGLSDMITRAGNTYSAISGEFTGHISTIKSALTAPFFEALKDSTRMMNALFTKYEDRITAIGTRIGALMARMGERFGAVFADGSPLSNALASMGDRFKLLWNDIDAGGPGGGGHNVLGAGGMAAGAVMGGPVVGLLIAGLASFTTHTEAVSQTLTSLTNAGSGMMLVLYHVSEIFGRLGEGIGNGLALILPTLAEMLNQTVQGLSVFFGYVSVLAGQLQEELGPGLMAVVGGLQSLFRGVSDFVGPALEFLGIAMLLIWRKVRDDVMPVFTWLTRGISELMDGIGYLLSMIGRELRAANVAARSHVSDADDPISRALARLAAPPSATVAANAAAAAARVTPRTPAARGGNHTHNDFRGSNFDITQKFAEGFDPDRIAAGFISDLESAATNRIQGGFEPLFSIR